MSKNNIVNSIRCIELVNGLDNIINEILYSKDSGYYNLSSKDAVENFDKILEKFNFETDKLSKKYDISPDNDLISEKKRDFVEKLFKHYESEILNWAYETYDEFINNILFQVSINKYDKSKIEKLYHRAQNAISWISTVMKYTSEETNAIISKFKIDFKNALLSDDSDYLTNSSPDESNPDVYLQLRKLISDNTKEFISLDLTQKSSQLSKNDILYFQKLQNLLKFDKTGVIDDINLIDYSIENLNINSAKDKYEYIKQINDDFDAKKPNSDDDKVDIIKRRMKIFEDKNKYYKKLLTL